MQSLFGRGLLLLLPGVVLVPAGCTAPAVVGKSPLTPAQMSPDSCVLEVCFVRFPFGDPEANEQLWQEVDEQQFPFELRRRLSRNGFRLGVLDGQIPPVLSRLLEMKDDSPATGGASQIDLAELGSAPPPVKRHLEIRAGQPKMIVASGVYDQLPVLICEPGELGGETYCQAQAVLLVKTFPERDGRVRVELLPELQHGELRQRWVGQDGMWRLEAGRQRRVFEEMAFSATLSPGCMLLLSSQPDRPGSLGHHFFTEDNGRPQQKLLVLRLAQTQHEGLFSPTRPLGGTE